MKRVQIGGTRLFWALGALALTPLTACDQVSDSSPEDYPSQRITLVSPFPAGGVTDGVARAYAPCVEDELDQKIIVENQPGGGGAVGHRAIVEGEPDGYTLLSTQASPVDVTPLFTPSVGYTPEDFSYVARVYNVTGGIFVPGDSEFDTIEDWIEGVRANPGSVTYGLGTPTGSLGAIALALQQDHDLPIQTVPFNGGSEVDTALLGGHIDSATAAITKSRLDLVAAGELKLLAVLAEERVPMTPDTVTLKEAGVNFTHGDEWFGILAPPGLDPEVSAKIADAFEVCGSSDPVLQALGEEWIPEQFVAGDDFRDLSLALYEQFKQAGVEPIE